MIELFKEIYEETTSSAIDNLDGVLSNKAIRRFTFAILILASPIIIGTIIYLWIKDKLEKIRDKEP